MPRRSTEWLNEWLARTPAARVGYDLGRESNGGRVRRESDLHRMIGAECGRKGLVVFHGRMDRASGRTPGEPDFTILLPGGRVLLVECKRPAGGRVSVEQQTVGVRASLLGHRVHLVTDFVQFRNLLFAELRAGAFARKLIQTKSINENSSKA